ncbi:MAG: DUF4318 domain-containing protein [Clostridium celatum]|nr:DUF4318 domain-containing protein [Clostridium celatum]MDU2123130.1 DUF4318 domain-containing protein [Clostridium celatum]MDU4979623.1 DUF4318 domain-containing protein [Clostridium celatum]
MKENLIKGANIGFTLLISSILTLRFTNDYDGMMKIFKYILPVLIGYVFIGIVFHWLRNIPRKNNAGSFGVAIYYWVFIIMIIVPVLAMFIDDYIRYMIMANILVIVALWLGEYIHISKIAKELNGGIASKHKTLIVDLDSKPKTKEEFFRIIESKCISRGDSLEYVERDIPAIIKINGELYKAEIGYYYAISGNAVYTLKLTGL